ncbi:hypothetical protein XA75_03785, partial [Listeria monocytogenes]|nr:hypothetical protein [Listeria monocytogenes]
MIVKVITNKANRDITINKLYPVIIKKDDEIRIVDDFGGLSIYELKDFQVFKENISSYKKNNNCIVYKSVDYPNFLENYYNDDKKALNEVTYSLLNIFEEDLNSEELVELITSEEYSNDEKMVFVETLENKITDSSVKILAKYFQNKQDIEPEFLLSICKLLSKYQIQ